MTREIFESRVCKLLVDVGKEYSINQIFRRLDMWGYDYVRKGLSRMVKERTLKRRTGSRPDEGGVWITDDPKPWVYLYTLSK